MVSKEKEAQLLARMESLGIRREDLRETFVRSPGPGGQKVNKTATCVCLVHIPTGIAVRCSRERSQSLNRFLARRILLDRLEALYRGTSPRLAKQEKIRRQKERRRRRAMKKISSAEAMPSDNGDET